MAEILKFGRNFEILKKLGDRGDLLGDGVDLLSDGVDLLGDGGNLLSDSGDLLGDGGDLLGDGVDLLGDGGNLLSDGGDLKLNQRLEIRKWDQPTYMGGMGWDKLAGTGVATAQKFVQRC